MSLRKVTKSVAASKSQQSARVSSASYQPPAEITMPPVVARHPKAVDVSTYPSYDAGSPYSIYSLIKGFGDNAGLVLIGLSIFILGFLAGSMWMENTLLKKGVVTNGGTAAAPAAPAAAAPAAAQQAPPAPVKVSLDKIKELFKSENIMFGKKDSKVLFVEFSDPSCPFCHVASGKNPEINKQMGERFMLKADGGTYIAPVEEMKKLVDNGTAGYVWMYSNGHGNGELASQALYCAYEKGKFWEAHDLLMNNEGYKLVNDVVKNDKAQSGKIADFLKGAVDSNFMKSCLEGGKYAARITEDQALGRTLGVNGTPGFFINESNFAGAYSYTDLEATVQAALK